MGIDVQPRQSRRTGGCFDSALKTKPNETSKVTVELEQTQSVCTCADYCGAPALTCAAITPAVLSIAHCTCFCAR